MRIPRAFVAAAAAAGALALALGTAAMPAQADQPDFICESYAPDGTDKIDTSGEPVTVHVDAPAGKLIDEYCVKASTGKYLVTVDPPMPYVDIAHPDKDSVSHYAVHYIDVPTVEELQVPAKPDAVDLCGIDKDEVVVPADTTDLAWSGGEIAGGTATVTVTALGGKSFVGGGTTRTFEFSFTTAACDGPPVLTQCTAYTSVHTTDLTTWNLSETKATGHNALVDGGLRIWTEGSTSTDKAAGYFPTNLPLAGLGTSTIDASLDYTSTTGPEPGLQLVVDFDADGTPDGILVGEKVYGDNWWLSNGATPAVKALAPHTGGGNGSNWFGTAQEWLTAFPEAVVKAVGYSLGSGVLGDGVITKITLGCATYTFGVVNPPVIEPKLTGVVATGECIADAPWIAYSLTLDDPQHRSTSNTARLVFTSGEQTHTVVLGELEDGKLSGKVLWPGASVAADEVTPTGWPGWEQLEDGTWVETDGNFAWTRDLTEVTLAVNPEVDVDLAYPEATPDCDLAPTPSSTPGGGAGSVTTASGDPSGLASTGFDGSVFVIVAGALMVLGGGVVLTARMRRRA